MSVLDGLTEIKLGSDPGSGVNPDVGYIFTWVELVGANYVLKYKTNGGVVGSVGTAGATPDFIDLADTPVTFTGQAGKTLKVNVGETAVEFATDDLQHWEDNPRNNEGITPVGNKEIAIGTPIQGREAVFGQGDSYTGVDNIYAYTYNGSSFVDETTKVTTEDSDKLTFAGNTDGNMIYLASKLDTGLDTLTHCGLKVKVDIATTLGSGDIVFEFYNGTSWEEFNHQSTDSSVPYYGHGNEKFEQTGSYQYLYNNTIAGSWVKNDPMLLGTSYYWIRLRISGTITSSPAIDRIKLHPPGRTEINEDGFITFYGTSMPVKNFPIYYGLFSAASNSPANRDIYLSDKLDVGMVENEFQTGTTDRSGLKLALPQDMCTANNVNIKFSFLTDSNTGSGDLDFTIRWGLFNLGSMVYTNTTAAPATAVGERSISGSYTMAANIQWELQEMNVSLEIPEGLPESVNGSDYLIVTFERQGSADSFTSDITMVDIKSTYTAWKLGGHS